MIRIEEAEKTYGSGSTTVTALRRVSLSVTAGEFVAIMGPSGCGKSTLLHVVGGLDRLSSGRVWVGNSPVHEMDEAALTHLRRTQIGVVFQFFNLLPTLTLEENVLLPGLLQGISGSELKKRATQLLVQVGLKERAGHRVNEVSGGEMQRAALARALLLKPRVILADEPTGNLDSEASGRVVDLFRRLTREEGVTLLLVTHSREVGAAADRLVTMRDGRIVETP